MKYQPGTTELEYLHVLVDMEAYEDLEMDFLGSGSEDMSQQNYYFDDIPNYKQQIRLEVKEKLQLVQMSLAELKYSGVPDDDDVLEEDITCYEHSISEDDEL